jgi:hypothetical protein
MGKVLPSIGFGLLVAACAGGDPGRTESGPVESQESIIRATSNGGPDQVVMLYITTLTSSGFGTRTCSGTYFAPRVVLTAAHCLNNVFGDQVFVYFGDNFTQDFSQLTPIGNNLVPPAPGQPSKWSKADSFEKNPSYDASLDSADMGAVYLDRKLPFDPLPLARFRLDNTWTNKTATISGWGANSAPTPTTGAGSRVQRTGTTHLLGSPTVADYHPEDPNPGMLVDSVRQTVVKIDGHAPNANSCFGDSGGPIIVNQFGQNYIAGVSYFGGLSCEDYSLYTRIDPFLPFLDQAYMKGGQATLIPNLECVAPNADGTFTAYYGYNNKNGASIDVPYGTKNQLALDVSGSRPTHFVPGVQHFVFGVDFTTNQTVSYSLAPDNSPRTTLTANVKSPRCSAAQASQVACGGSCRAELRSGCPDVGSFTDCMASCMSTVDFIDEILPECQPQNTAVNNCFAQVPPGLANWFCIDGSLPAPTTACATEVANLNACFGF